MNTSQERGEVFSSRAGNVGNFRTPPKLLCIGYKPGLHAVIQVKISIGLLVLQQVGGARSSLPRSTLPLHFMTIITHNVPHTSAASHIVATATYSAATRSRRESVRQLNVGMGGYGVFHVSLHAQVKPCAEHFLHVFWRYY